VFASTWNVGGIVPSDDLDLEDWLDSRDNFYDIYALGYPVQFDPLSYKLLMRCFCFSWIRFVQMVIQVPGDSATQCKKCAWP
jgi:hypothetical protein